MDKSKKWTEEDLNFLKENYICMTDEELSKKLNRTISSIQTKRQRLKLNSEDKHKNDIIKYVEEQGYIYYDMELRERKDSGKVKYIFISCGKHEPYWVCASSFITKNSRCIKCIAQERSGWTDEELLFLENNYVNFTDEELAIKLNKTENIVREKRHRLHLSRFDTSKITDDMKKIIITQYQSGKQMTDIACKLNLHPWRVLNLLKKEGIHQYVNQRWTQDELNYLIENYAHTEWESLELYLNRDKICIQDKASSLNLKREIYFWTDEDIDVISKLYKKGYSYFDIYEEINHKYTIDAIKTKLYKLGIMNPRDFWTVEEDNKLIENYSKVNTEELMKMFPNRTREAITVHAKLFNLQHSSIWTDDEDQIIRENYRKLSDYEISELINRTVVAVRARRCELKLFKDSNSGIGISCESINGDFCDSINEKRITDYFIKNKIKYIKNNRLFYSDYITNDQTQRRFDWILFTKDESLIFVEYWGLYRKTPRCKVEELYSIKMENKINDCVNNGLFLLEIFPQDVRNKNMNGFIKKLNKLELKLNEE